MGHTLYLTFMGLLEFESQSRVVVVVAVMVDSKENQQCFAWQLPQVRLLKLPQAMGGQLP